MRDIMRISDVEDNKVVRDFYLLKDMTIIYGTFEHGQIGILSMCKDDRELLTRLKEIRLRRSNKYKTS